MSQVDNAPSHQAELAVLRLLANMLASMVNIPIRECIMENLEKDPVVRTILKLIEEGKTY